MKKAAQTALHPALGYIDQMGSVLRSLWICLLILALPVQGMAAATMVFCSPAGHPAAVVQAAGHEQVPGSAGPPHEMHHQHQCHHQAQHAQPIAENSTPVSADVGLHDTHEAGHTCSACASCCAAAVILVNGAKLVAIDLAASPPGAALVGVGPFATDAPERPPRALLA